MRIAVPDSPYSSPASSPPSSPPSPESPLHRPPLKPLSNDPESSSSRRSPASGDPGPSTLANSKSSRRSSKVPESKETFSLRQCTWEEKEFYTAVKLRLRKDPLEELQEKERQLAWQEGQTRAQRNWEPILDRLGLNKSGSSNGPRSPELDEWLENAHEKQMQELSTIMQGFQLESERTRAEGVRRSNAERKKFWDDIEATIKVEEARLAKIAAEKEAARRAEEERQRKLKEAEEARQRALEAEAKKKAEEEAAAKKAKEEEVEKERKRKEDEAKTAKEALERKAAEEEKRRQTDKYKDVAPKTARQEFELYRNRLRFLKTEIMPLVRGNKSDESMINKEWRKVWSATRRSFTPKIGQVTNSQSEIDRIANLIHGSLMPNPPHPDKLYVALLSSLAKAFLLQAETEVTAKASTAYPLARLILKIVELGHPLLPEVFMARLVGRTGGWSVGAVVPRYEGQSDDEFRKSLGYGPASSSETLSQFIDRLTGMLTLYAAILQTSASGFAASQPGNLPYPFQLPRLWTLLARITTTPQLIHTRAAPQVLYALIETAGDRLLEAYGKQIIKMMKTIAQRCVMDDGDQVIGGKDGKAARVRLGLLLDKWAKEGKVGGTGRDVGV